MPYLPPYARSKKESLAIPIYTYQCPDKHVFDRRAGYNAEMVDCSVVLNPTTMTRRQLDLLNPDQQMAVAHGANVVCHKKARRRPYYEDTAVSFTGTGFTQTIIPPGKPKAGTKAGEPTGDWFEKLDRHAEAVYKDDENVQPYRKEQAKKMLTERDRGAIS